MDKTYGVLSTELTGRQPIFVDREAVNEVEVHLATVTVHMSGERRIVLVGDKRRPEGTLQAVAEAIFPRDCIAQSEEIRLLTKRSINPAAIQLLDWVSGTVLVGFRDGTITELPGGGVDRYRQIVAIVYGSIAGEMVKTIELDPVARKVPELQTRVEAKPQLTAAQTTAFLATADRAIALAGDPRRIGPLVDEVCGFIDELRPSLNDSLALEKEGVIETMAALDAKRKELGTLVGQLMMGSSDVLHRVGVLGRDIVAIVQRLEVRSIESRKEIIRQCQRLALIGVVCSEETAPKTAWPLSILTH